MHTYTCHGCRMKTVREGYFFPDFYFLYYPLSPSHARREEEGEHAMRRKCRRTKREREEKKYRKKRTSSRGWRLRPASVYIQIDLPWRWYFHTRAGSGCGGVTLSSCAGHARSRRYDNIRSWPVRARTRLTCAHGPFDIIREPLLLYYYIYVRACTYIIENPSPHNPFSSGCFSLHRPPVYR
jgi:hypothetical protein